MSVLENQAEVTYKIDNKKFSDNSNITTFTVIQPSLKINKSQNVSSGVVGDTVSFTVSLTNTSSTDTINNVVVTDDLNTVGYTYIANTAKVDNVSTTDSPVTGITVGTILPSQTRVVTFDATVN